MPRTVLNRLKPIGRKLYASGKKLSTLGKPTTRPTIPLPSIPITYVGQEDPAVQEILNVMGGHSRDLTMARRVAKLKEQIPAGTVPELITYLWLRDRGIDFEYQVEAQGGRAHTGGSVIDFVVRNGRVWAWRIQGTYFHNLPQQQVLDEIRRKLLEGAVVMGQQLDGVVDLWEQRIYADREEVFTLGLVGIEMGE